MPRNRRHFSASQCALGTLSALVAFVASLRSASAQPFADEFSLKKAWQDAIASPDVIGGWADGPGEHYGQVCDPWRQPETVVWPKPDRAEGCVAVWLSERDDNFTVGNLPRNQRNDFQNTQHYRGAWNFNGHFGLKSNSLPQANIDIDPVCYVANISGRLALGYEEGNGGVLMPCPGSRGGFDFSEEDIATATDEELKTMCAACYQAVCTNQGSHNPRYCGRAGDGGVDLGDADVVSDNLQQVGSAYHCHLTMGNEGSCDYVQYDQHEASREYNMSSGVMCGWQNVQYLNLTYCDCTKQAGQANNCQAAECLKMAMSGVVCGNCGDCHSDYVYEAIFDTLKPDAYNAPPTPAEAKVDVAVFGADMKATEEPAGIVHYEDSDYWIHRPADGFTHSEAEAYCVSHGAHLASFHSAAEYTFVMDTLQVLHNGTLAKGWMGLNDLEMEGQFEWIDGTPTTYTQFRYNQPDNAGGGEHCVENMHYYPQWNDAGCDMRFVPCCGGAMGAICKRSAPPPPVADIYNSFDGTCAMAKTAPTPELREHYTMLCSQGIFCREHNHWNARYCAFHCEMFPDSPICSSTPPSRRLLEIAEGEQDAAEEGEEEVIKAVSASGRKLRMV